MNKSESHVLVLILYLVMGKNLRLNRNCGLHMIFYGKTNCSDTKPPIDFS